MSDELIEAMARAIWRGRMDVDEVNAIIAELHRRAAAEVDPNSPVEMDALRKAWDRNPPCPNCGGFGHFECD